MKDTINEGLTYITHHFVVLHPFQETTNFINIYQPSDLTKKISLLFGGVQIIPYFLAYISNCSQYLFKLYVDIETFYLLLKYCLMYFVLYLPDVTCGQLCSHICSNKAKNEVKKQISHQSQSLQSLIFIPFSSISQFQI